MSRADLQSTKVVSSREPDGRSSFEPAVQPLAISPETAQGAARLSRAESVPVSEVFLTAFQTVLYRYTSRESVAILLSRGVARREFADELSFREVLTRGRVDPSGPSTESLSAQDLAFLEEGVASSRFDSVLFDFGPARPLEAPSGRFELALSLSEEPEGVRGALFYDLRLFDEATVARLRGHFLSLLDAAVVSPERHIGALPLLTSSELHRILVEWNDTARAPLPESNVARLFEEQVERSPERAAVTLGGEVLTYRELDGRSNRLAHALRALGVGPGIPVGICMERSLEMAVAVLGTLKSGGAYAALDPEYPRERLEFMLRDSGAPVILTDETSAGKLPGQAGKTIALGSESAAALLVRQPETPVVGGAGPEDLAYLIYTSGSTGRPKGVAMPHRSLINLLAWQRDAALNPAARTLQFASLNFDVSFQEMFSTWCCGGTLVLAPERIRRDAGELWRLLAAESVERLFLPFIALQQLAEAAERDGLDAPGLREIVTAGEQLQITPQIARLFRDGSRRLQNQYGPSESHVVTAFTLSGPSERWPTLPPIGHPISNVRIYLLDRFGQPVPVGVPGELHVGGAGVAHGYWNRPDLTAQAFLSDPYAEEPGARLYKTGDLARYREDGEIEFLGRLDQQIKIRGYRVEPGEIEAALARHPAVRTSVVVPRADETGIRSLVAYVVPKPGRTVRVRELRDFLKETLPEYMLPAAFVALPELPLTPSGKVDRRALAAPVLSDPMTDQDYLAPRDAVELALARMWAKCLGRPRVGVRDDFFDLGGNSIVAARLFAQIQRVFDRNLDPTALLRAPTIERLAPLLRHLDQAGAWSSLVPIRAEGNRPPLFCMHAGAGTVLFYYPLARELGEDQPVYGLQARGLYGKQTPHSRVEEMATHYIQEIQTVQAHGPYHLAGFCLGAVLAFEVARQLSQEGERVSLLASFDGAAPGYDYYWIDHPRERLSLPSPHSLGERLSYHWAHLRRFGWSYVAEALRYRGIQALRKIQYRWGRRYVDRGLPVPRLLRGRYFLVNHQVAENAYAPGKYPERMVIFETEGLFPDPRLGWQDLIAGGLEIHRIPADHRSHRDLMTGGFVARMAALLRTYLSSEDAAPKPAA
jgi:amino acid adenylation domain-containing protein